VLGPKFGRRTLQVGVAVSGLGWGLLVLALRGHGTVDFVNLMPGLFAAGLGLGLVVAPMFDIILASVTERETGSASGVLNAGQQLAGSIGVAVLGTVFFDTIAGGNFHRGLSDVLAIELGASVVLLGLSFLLPHRARAEQADSTTTASDRPT
jgi:MFS family permease